MKHQWIWLLTGQLMIAGLAGCAQATPPFAAETAPETTPASSQDLIVGTVKPTIELTNTSQIEPTVTGANLNEAPPPARTQTPGLQAETASITLTQGITLESVALTPIPISSALATSVPITTAQIIQEEIVTIENTPIPTPSDPDLQALIRQAQEDLAARLGIDIDQIKTLEVRQVVWPDTSLGCPEEGIAYQQVPQEGLLIRLGVDNRMYLYHSDKTQAPFLCEQTSEIFKKGTPKIDELVPPPDWEIE